jgi:hypothetical protein
LLSDPGAGGEAGIALGQHLCEQPLGLSPLLQVLEVGGEALLCCVLRSAGLEGDLCLSHLRLLSND